MNSINQLGKINKYMISYTIEKVANDPNIKWSVNVYYQEILFNE